MLARGTGKREREEELRSKDGRRSFPRARAELAGRGDDAHQRHERGARAHLERPGRRRATDFRCATPTKRHDRCPSGHARADRLAKGSRPLAATMSRYSCTALDSHGADCRRENTLRTTKREGGRERRRGRARRGRGASESKSRQRSRACPAYGRHLRRTASTNRTARCCPTNRARTEESRRACRRRTRRPSGTWPRPRRARRATGTALRRSSRTRGSRGRRTTCTRRLQDMRDEVRLGTSGRAARRGRTLVVARRVLVVGDVPARCYAGRSRLVEEEAAAGRGRRQGPVEEEELEEETTTHQRWAVARLQLSPTAGQARQAEPASGGEPRVSRARSGRRQRRGDRARTVSNSADRALVEAAALVQDAVADARKGALPVARLDERAESRAGLARAGSCESEESATARSRTRRGSTHRRCRTSHSSTCRPSRCRRR